MNLKKFISGISALTIAASAFAGMAVTASAADTTLISFNGSESTASTTKLVSIGSNSAATSETYGTGLQVEGAMTVSGVKYTWNELYVLNSQNHTRISSAVAHNDDTTTDPATYDNYYLLYASNGSNGNSSGSAAITGTGSASTYGQYSFSFAFPQMSRNTGLQIAVGDLATLNITAANSSSTSDPSAPFDITISAGSKGGSVSGDTTFSGINYDTWFDAVLNFNLSTDTAMLTLTDGTNSTTTYFTGVTATSENSITFTAKTCRYTPTGGTKVNSPGAILFDDVILKSLDEAPTTTASNAAVLTVKCGTAEDDDLLGTYEIACLKGDTVDITSDANYKAYYDVDGYRYTKSSGETSVTITAATQTAKLVYTQGAIPDVNVVINAVNSAGTESHQLTEISKKDDEKFYYTLTRYVKFDDGYYYKYNTFGSNCEVSGTAKANMNPVNVVYTQTANEYFYEAEDYVTDASYIGYQTGVSARHSGGSAVVGLGYLSNSASVTTTHELPAGTYTVTIGYRPSPGNRAFALFNGSTGDKVYTSGVTGSGGGYNTEVAVENVYIKDNGYVYLKGTGVDGTNYATPEIDYIAIARTGDLPSYDIHNENANVSVATTGALYSTVTISAASNYELSDVSVATTAGATTVDVTDNGDGTYSFTMPSEAVTVTATATAVSVPTSAAVTEVTYNKYPAANTTANDQDLTAAKIYVTVTGSINALGLKYSADGESWTEPQYAGAIQPVMTGGNIVLGAIVPGLKDLTTDSFKAVYTAAE